MFGMYKLHIQVVWKVVEMGCMKCFDMEISMFEK
jgi:hypothetical protein